MASIIALRFVLDELVYFTMLRKNSAGVYSDPFSGKGGTIVNGSFFLYLVPRRVFFVGVAFDILVDAFMKSCIINFGRACFLLGSLFTISLDLFDSDLLCAFAIAGNGANSFAAS